MCTPEKICAQFGLKQHPGKRVAWNPAKSAPCDFTLEAQVILCGRKKEILGHM